MWLGDFRLSSTFTDPLAYLTIFYEEITMEKYLVLERDGTGQWQNYRVVSISRAGLAKDIAESLCESLNKASTTELHIVVAAPFVEEK